MKIKNTLLATVLSIFAITPPVLGSEILWMKDQTVNKALTVAGLKLSSQLPVSHVNAVSSALQRWQNSENVGISGAFGNPIVSECQIGRDDVLCIAPDTQNLLIASQPAATVCWAPTNCDIIVNVAQQSFPTSMWDAIFGHELGHVFGLPHSCGGNGGADGTPACVAGTLEDQALMRGSFGANPPESPQVWDLSALDAMYVLHVGNSNRFEVRVTGKDFSNQPFFGKVVQGHQSLDAGLFYFFSAENWELMIKVLDACGINNHFWVFAAATTNVEYTIKVTDKVTGVEKTYRNPLGMAASAITDIEAFATCSSI